jgi:uncharacterized membrane-anchored protein
MNTAMPAEYEDRRALNDELHHHPYEPLTPPERVVFLSMLVTPEERLAEDEHLRELEAHFGDMGGESHFNRTRHDFGKFRLKIERHFEFTRYKFVWRTDENCERNPFADSIASMLPPAWLARLPGKMLSGLNVAFLVYPESESNRTLTTRFACYFDPQTLVGSRVGRSGGLVLTDFKIKQDGLIPMLVFSRAQLATQNGRLMLRLIEVEAYRSLGLLALPEAKKILRILPGIESDLAEVTKAVATSKGGMDDELLERLTDIATRAEHMMAVNYQRLSATPAYLSLVFKRLRDLREEPVEDLTSLGSILERRLEPVKTTCESVLHRMEQLSVRISNASQLLRTRIDVRREAQNQELLIGMNRRFQAQLRLQETAELLSVVIVPYYAVNLLAYVVEEIGNLAGSHIDPTMIKAFGIPVVVGLTLYLIRRMHGRESI